jgi:uncharacterized membrane protein YdjX (TVP38/TMEM64 family)
MSADDDAELELPVPPPRPATWADWARLAIPFAVLAALFLYARQRGYFDYGAQDAAALARSARDTPGLALTLSAIYAGLAALAMPVAPLGYGAGALYGLARGAVLVWVASMFGAALGYFLAHGIMRGPALRVLGRFASMIHSLRERHGFMTVLRIQLLPLIAFGPFNYAAGIAGIPFWPFMAATGVGILPGTIAIVYVGDRVMAGIRGEGGHPFLIAAIVSVALVALSFMPTVVMRRRRARRRSAGYLSEHQ